MKNHELIAWREELFIESKKLILKSQKAIAASTVLLNDTDRIKSQRYGN